MRNFYAFLAAGIFLFGGSSCNIINPSEVVPTYVHIDSFSFTGNPALYGSSSHKITNVYVFFDNASLGVYDLPATFPVIAKATGVLTVIPGIDEDGRSVNEQVYPFYKNDTITLVPAPGNTVNVAPKTSYRESTSLAYHEPFEIGSTEFKRVSGDADPQITSDHSEIFEGSGALKIRLEAGKDSTTIKSGSFKLTTGVDAYIEMDYKGTLSMAVGMSTILNSTGNVFDGYFGGLRPRAEWGKVYFKVKDFVSTNQGAEYQIIIRTTKQPGLTDGYLLIDNVKLVTFK